MSKKKKKKDHLQRSMEKLILRQYLKGAPGIGEKSFESSPLILMGQTCQNVPPGDLEETVAEQRLANCVMEKVMERLTPYIIAQWQDAQHNQKKQKSMGKRIRRLETQVARLKLEQEQLCQALAYFLSAAANVSVSSASAADLEKEFKALYKQYRKAHKYSSKKADEQFLLPMKDN